MNSKAKQYLTVGIIISLVLLISFASYFVIAGIITTSQESVDPISQERIITWNVTNKDYFGEFVDISIKRIDNFTHIFHYELNQTFLNVVNDCLSEPTQGQQISCAEHIFDDWGVTGRTKGQFTSDIAKLNEYPIKDKSPGVSLSISSLNLMEEGSFTVTSSGVAGEVLKLGFGSITVEAVDATATSGYDTSLALDSDGKAHISHWDVTNKDMRYCNNTVGSWSCVVVDTLDESGYTSTAVDSNDIVHIAYCNATTKATLHYANNTGGAWSSVLVESGGADQLGYYLSLAVDSNDIVHIAHADVTNADLRYCNNTGGSWSCVVAVDENPSWISIAVDSNDIIHISYQDVHSSADMRLGYCNNTVGSWNCEDIEVIGEAADHTSIAIDSNDMVHITHYDNEGENMRYCNNTVGSWSCVVVESAGDVPLGCVHNTIAIDINDRVHTSFRNVNYERRYCNNTVGGVWSCLTLEVTGTGAGCKSWTMDRGIAIKKGRIVDSIDYSDYAHSSWRNETYNGLVYGTVWSGTGGTLDTTPPNVTIVSPTNTTYSALDTIWFNLTVVDDIAGVDACLYSLDLSSNITMSNNTASTFYDSNATMAQGSHTVYFYCNDTSNNLNATEQEIFNIYQIDINLVSPANNTIIYTTGSNFTANHTIYSGELKNTTYYIWYENSTIFNQTTRSINGTTNTTTLWVNGFDTENYMWNTLVCAEDSGTYCYFNEENNTFSVGVQIIDESYSYWTYETAEQLLSVDVTLFEDTSLVSANLVYNHTNYVVSNISISGNDYVLTRVIDTPLNPSYFTNVSNDFYWSFTYVDAAETQTEQNTTTHQQNVTFLVISICNSTYSSSDSHALNFTMYDELTTDPIEATTNATTLRTTFDYWMGSGDIYKSYSYNNVTNSNETGNSYSFCIFPRNETLSTDMDMEYSAIDYSTRKYYLTDAPLDNVTNNIRLELLTDADSVKFFIEVRKGMVGFDDATVTISKYFTGEGIYRTTEIRETDVDGKFVAYLDLDQTYHFLVVKGGVSYGTITAQALCTEAPCELILQVEEAVTDMWQGYYDEFAASVSYTLTYNDTLKLVTYTFNDLTGLAQSFALDVNQIKYDEPSDIVLEPAGTYCNKTLATVTGTLTCNMTDYTKGDFKATGYITRSPPKIVNYIMFVISSIKDTLGLLGIFVSFLIIVVVGLVGCWNPAVGVVLTAFAILMMKILGFVAFGWTTVILIMIMAGILIFRMKS